MTYLLEVEDVRKAFPGVVALDGVSMRVKPGTVHALVGENGAGKSTLMKVITGLYRPDAGRVTVRGRTAMIHQELHLMPSMTVAPEKLMGGALPVAKLPDQVAVAVFVRGSVGGAASEPFTQVYGSFTLDPAGTVMFSPFCTVQAHPPPRTSVTVTPKASMTVSLLTVMSPDTVKSVPSPWCTVTV